jgi:2-methylcitrate dehydratase PrpD
MASTGAAHDPVVEAFAAWSARLRWQALPPATRRLVHHELLDYLGCLIAGRALMGLPRWLEEIVHRGGRADAAMVGGPRLPAPAAALANGYYGHVLEYDDTHDAAVLHAGAAAIPAALAAAQMSAVSEPRRLLEAVTLGIELTCRLGVATRLNLIEGGWLYTPLFGHFGAAAAASRLVSPDGAAFHDALGIAYALACGNHEATREGATTKHAQPGFAAHNGVQAALMAAHGLDGARGVFCGEDGMARVYLRGRFEPQAALAALGERFEIDRLSFKPYPTCRLTHPAVSAALALREQIGGQVEAIASLRLLLGPQAYDVVGRPEPGRVLPSSKVPAQFSAYWAVAVALAHGGLAPAHLFSEIPPSPAVRALIDRIGCEAAAAGGSRDVGGCTLVANGRFGERRIRVDHAQGHPSHPLSTEALADKFVANAAAAGWRAPAAREFAARVLALDEARDCAFLYAALSDAAAAPRRSI